MKFLRITNIQRGCVYDGNGVRTTFFLKGCHFSCPWCCNPETSHEKAEVFFDREKCDRRIEEKSSICIPCIRNGGERPTEKCPFEYVRPASSTMSLQKIVEVCLNDISLFKTSGGGVTFSGGEPLLQSDNLHDLLRQLKIQDIDVALETTLAVMHPQLIPLVDFVDEFIIDYKLQPCMNLYDRSYHKLISDNLKLLPHTKRIRHRLVFIDEMEKATNDIIDSINNLKIDNLELLKCHNLAQSKYQRLNIVNKNFSASENKMERFRTALQSNGIAVQMLKI